MTKRRVAMGEFAVQRGAGELSTIGLGSCVAIALYDPETRVGALGHVVLPSQALSRDSSNEARFPDTAIPAMLDAMRSMGAGARVWAKIAGGARMFSSLIPAGVPSMGDRNVQATRQALARAGIRVAGEDVGGERGRSVFFDVASGMVRVRAVAREEHVL